MRNVVHKEKSALRVGGYAQGVDLPLVLPDLYYSKTAVDENPDCSRTAIRSQMCFVVTYPRESQVSIPLTSLIRGRHWSMVQL